MFCAKGGGRCSILQETCERFIFVNRGAITLLPDYAALVADERVRSYLGRLAPAL